MWKKLGKRMEKPLGKQWKYPMKMWKNTKKMWKNLGKPWKNTGKIVGNPLRNGG